MTELLLRPLADAFLDVGVFVALMVLPFGWARLRWGTGLDRALERHRRWGPIGAALLTVPPGCGGAIAVMSLYARGSVSYGSAIAALVATMGDAAWLLLAADPVLTVQLKLLLVATGVVTGYVVDAARIRPRRRADACVDVGSSLASVSGAAPSQLAVPVARPVPVARVAAVPRAEHTVSTPHALVWLAVGVGVVLGLAATLRLVPVTTVGSVLLGGIDVSLLIGLGGSAAAIAVFACNRARVTEVSDGHPATMRQVLSDGADEVAFITVWVAVVYLALSLLQHLTGFDGSALPLLGVTGVVIGALAGLVPGCALQLVFVGLFLTGGMPVSTLVANSLSQDGDALLPLLALERRSALLAMVLTTIPALAVGLALVALG